MLPDEIKPFADFHIEKLEDAEKLLKKILDTYPGPVIANDVDQVHESIGQLRNARNALVRFKVCMADEVKQKIRYRNRWMKLRFTKE